MSNILNETVPYDYYCYRFCEKVFRYEENFEFAIHLQYPRNNHFLISDKYHSIQILYIICMIKLHSNCKYVNNIIKKRRLTSRRASISNFRKQFQYTGIVFIFIEIHLAFHSSTLYQEIQNFLFICLAFN